MNRMYELAIVTEPRQSDDDVQAICARMIELIEQSGAKVYHTDHWGKRKLAYPIRKFNEGKYSWLYASAEGGSVPQWGSIERLLLQDERVLRHLVVRTDEDLKRALRKGKIIPETPGMTEEEVRAFLGVPEGRAGATTQQATATDEGDN